MPHENLRDALIRGLLALADAQWLGLAIRIGIGEAGGASWGFVSARLQCGASCRRGRRDAWARRRDAWTRRGQKGSELSSSGRRGCPSGCGARPSLPGCACRSAAYLARAARAKARHFGFCKSIKILMIHHNYSPRFSKRCTEMCNIS